MLKAPKGLRNFIQFNSRYCFAMSNKTSICTDFHITTMYLYFQSRYPYTVQTHSKLLFLTVLVLQSLPEVHKSFSVSELLTEWNR